MVFTGPIGREELAGVPSASQYKVLLHLPPCRRLADGIQWQVMATNSFFRLASSLGVALFSIFAISIKKTFDDDLALDVVRRPQLMTTIAMCVCVCMAAYIITRHEFRGTSRRGEKFVV